MMHTSPHRLITLEEYRQRHAASPDLAPRMTDVTRKAFGPGNRVEAHRAAFDFYPTPLSATEALLSVESFDGPIWEPACGKGHISRVLEAHKYSVVSTDLADWGYGSCGRDFLLEKVPLAKHIVTNPPYGKGLADAFVSHALRLTAETDGTVAMLLAFQSLAGPYRHDFWEAHPPSVIYALDHVQCWPYGDPSRATTAIGKQRYAWVVWSRKRSRTTEFRWLRTQSRYPT